MATTRADVEARALELFGPARAAEAQVLIDAYGVEGHEREVHRVQLAILDVSEGKMNRLPYFVMCAKIDHRDLLTGARLPPMSDEEEALWQASADRMLALWTKR